jgi:preprotein translocase subunit SecF
MLSGTYSSIFIATPVLADLKERDPKYRELAARIGRRQAGGRSAQGATAAPAAAPLTVTAVAVEPADGEAGLDDESGVTVPATARSAAATGTGDTAAPRPVRPHRVNNPQRRSGTSSSNKKKRR